MEGHKCVQLPLIIETILAYMIITLAFNDAVLMILRSPRYYHVVLTLRLMVEIIGTVWFLCLQVNQLQNGMNLYI